MNHFDIRSFDLNLVRVFLAIWELRSVTAAGERLGLTQPAVSHSLRRLREQFSDPLFLRAGQHMEPTDAARRLHEPFANAMHIIGETVLRHEEFEPEKSDRTFTLAMSDISEAYLLPPLLTRIEQVAPRVHIRSVQLDAASIEVALRSGQVDSAIGYLPDLTKPDFISTFVVQDWFICLVNASHPMAGKTISEDDFLKMNFVDVAVHATGYKMVETMLDQIGARRFTAARIEHFTVVPEIVRKTGFAAIFSHFAAEKVNERGEYALLELPFDVPKIEVKVHVHANFRNDNGIRWLQQTLVDLFRQ